MNLILIGAGQRGMIYSRYCCEQGHTVVAVAEPDDARRESARTAFGLPEDACYRTAEDLLSRPRMADAAIIATMDLDHYSQAIRAMELGYDPETGDIRFIEPAVGGKIMAVITVPELRPQIATIRPGTFKYAPCGARGEISVIEEEISFDPGAVRCRRLDYFPDESDPELDIANADCIVCVGNGLKDQEHLERYRTLAKLLGGKIGCTRPLYERGILPYKLQIGQSGVMVKTKLYISFGVSGAVNHTAGVDADVFVAVDKNPDAQIFNFCDYGIVGDMDEVCDEMIAQLRARKGQ